MSGSAFQVACLRLAAYEQLFSIGAVPDWPVLKQNQSLDGVLFLEHKGL